MRFSKGKTFTKWDDSVEENTLGPDNMLDGSSNIEYLKGKTVSEIVRPSFKSGTVNLNFDAEKIPKSIRFGLGNREIVRHNFEAPAIKPRTLDFDSIQAIDLENYGQKIQLSEKTIEEIFKTRVPDPQDTSWLAEKRRMTAVYLAQGMSREQIERELDMNKPLGREQRTVSSRQNIGQSALTTNEKLVEIKQEIAEGRAESQAQQALLIGQLALIFNNVNTVEQLSRVNLADLAADFKRLNVPKNHKQLGLSQRYVDIDFYNANAGLINVLLISNVESDPNYSQGSGALSFRSPVYNFTSSGGKIKTVMLSTLVSKLGDKKKRRYLDLKERGMINDQTLVAAAQSIGINFPDPYNNEEFSISPANQPAIQIVKPPPQPKTPKTPKPPKPTTTTTSTTTTTTSSTSSTSSTSTTSLSSPPLSKEQIDNLTKLKEVLKDKIRAITNEIIKLEGKLKTDPKNKNIMDDLTKRMNNRDKLVATLQKTRKQLKNP